MKSRTLFQCWFLIITVMAFAFICEFMITSFQVKGQVRLHRLAPITSLPVILKEARQKSKDSKLKKEQKIKYALVTLKNGKTIQGDVIEETDSWVTLKVDKSEVGFARNDMKEFSIIPRPVKEAS